MADLRSEKSTDKSVVFYIYSTVYISIFYIYLMAKIKKIVTNSNYSPINVILH